MPFCAASGQSRPPKRADFAPVGIEVVAQLWGSPGQYKSVQSLKPFQTKDYDDL